MQTKRDHLQAYRFIRRRAAYALLRAEPDTAETPLRTLGLATVAGLVVFGLLAAGAGIWGVIRPTGARDWRDPGKIIVEKETGARYVLTDGVLHPVLNYASARLLAGSGAGTTAAVPRSRLAGVPRGLPVGIPGAPDTLAAAADLVAGPWVACAGQQTDDAGVPMPTVALSIGAMPAGRELGGGEALLVSGRDSTRYLVWAGHRYRLAGDSVAGALGYAASTPVPVGAAWLDAVPPGPDLAPPDLPRRGDTGPEIGGRPSRVGQVLVSTGTGTGTADSYYLVLPDGLASLTPTGAALVLGDPRSRAAYPGAVVAAVSVAAADTAAASTSGTAPLPAGLPPAPPRLLDPGPAQVCAGYAQPPGPDPVPTVLIDALPPAAGRTASTDLPPAGGPEAGATDLADRVWLPPGRAAVVQALPALGATTGTRYLITDLGVRFPVPSADVLTALGYAGVAPTPVPWLLLRLVPVGPPLDPAAARTYQPPAAATTPP
ncbi:MAG TPA: type VII secretion protein EccB [Mycobacteriales bacterium]|nr:type VII secretion protein EccB [Mycobacteriales bacterium]